MPGNSKNLIRLWEELKRRNVVRVAIVYLAAAYAILESSTIIFPRLGLPDWTVNLVMILLFIGLIIVIIFSWIYDITPEGVRVTDIENGKFKSKYLETLEGKTIANYQILEKIGKGSLGIMYKAKDSALNRKVSLTFLSDWICADKVVRARLIEKAQAAAGIVKPGMTTIYSVEKDNEAVFIVMEYNDNLLPSERVPAELEAIIIDAIKDHSGEEEDRKPETADSISTKDSPYIASHEVASGHPAEIEYLHSPKGIPRRHISFPRIITSGKITFPAVVVVIILILIFNWSSVNRILGTGKSKREEALTHIYIGEEYFKLGNYRAAQTEFEVAIDLDPENSVAWSNLAAANTNQNNFSDAIMQTIRAIELDKNNFKAAYNLAYALDERNDFVQAIEWYSRTIEMDSTFLPAYSALGRAYNLSGMPVDAILILNRALKKFAESDSIYLVQKNIGYSYLLIDQYGESIKYLASAYNSESSDPETALYLARSYEANGEIVRATELWGIYIDLESDSLKVSDARAHLKEITRQYLDDMTFK